VISQSQNALGQIATYLMNNGFENAPSGSYGAVSTTLFDLKLQYHRKDPILWAG